MTAFNISGLVSGIDTNALISQLMTAAAAPQTALQGQATADQIKISTYQAVNSKLAAVQTAAQALTSSATWSSTTATSSSSTVVATGSTSAQAGSFTTFSVVTVATGQVSTVSAGATIANPAAGLDIIGTDSIDHHIALSDGSPATVAAAVNAAGLAVRASVI
ncbi:MAG TPA: flagellar cap protein FliD N-terminal domain-containing protein, partial [Candidatus Acidoferrum sp.]|nr:flagellar cap protein FliD N-terminal domain-containing protein [Candidatus Acidoferrum sp.]